MPKILGANLEEHRRHVRRRVFEAFATLLRERGYDALSLADLAAEAGIGRTVIYNHFPDKDAVVVAFAAEETQRYLDRLAMELTGVDDPQDQLRRYVRHHLRSAEEMHLGLGPQLYAMLSRDSLVEIRAHVRAVEEVVGTILDRGMELGVFARTDLPTAIALVHACLQPRHLPSDAVEAFVLRGVGAASGQPSGAAVSDA